ncbi:bcl-2-like protein 15 [Eublepharis macularius]|uniref:Bcl-2-like protein 15 n=1 Tax=Eublepharis macularius TaxID=481883 RepID=A0AA97L1S7_EUBMA|nr:bcl-2-like protein 15 [Eublepharis macularius]
MKNSMTFEEQTEKIVEVLLSDFLEEKLQIECRGLDSQPANVTEAAAGDTSSIFDPVIIASRLQEIGDQYNKDLTQHVHMLAAEMVEGKLEKFGEMVESLSKEWCSYNPGLEYERAFLAVSVRLFKYLVRKVSSVAQSALLTGLINGNAQVRVYIEEHGGWENVEN